MVLLDTDAVLGMIGVSRATLRLLRKEKGFPEPEKKIGVKIMFSQEKVSAWIDKSGYKVREGRGGVIDLSGKKFGKLTVVKKIRCDQNGKAIWATNCDCGNNKEVSGVSLRNGHVKSCGCLQGAHLSHYREVSK